MEITLYKQVLEDRVAYSEQPLYIFLWVVLHSYNYSSGLHILVDTYSQSAIYSFVHLSLVSELTRMLSHSVIGLMQQICTVLLTTFGR